MEWPQDQSVLRSLAHTTFVALYLYRDGLKCGRLPGCCLAKQAHFLDRLWICLKAQVLKSLVKGPKNMSEQPGGTRRVRVAKVGIIVGRGRGSIAKPLRNVGERK